MTLNERLAGVIADIGRAAHDAGRLTAAERDRRERETVLELRGEALRETALTAAEDADRAADDWHYPRGSVIA